LLFLVIILLVIGVVPIACHLCHRNGNTGEKDQATDEDQQEPFHAVLSHILMVWLTGRISLDI